MEGAPTAFWIPSRGSPHDPHTGVPALRSRLATPSSSISSKSISARPWIGRAILRTAAKLGGQAICPPTWPCSLLSNRLGDGWIPREPPVWMICRRLVYDIYDWQWHNRIFFTVRSDAIDGLSESQVQTSKLANHDDWWFRQANADPKRCPKSFFGAHTHTGSPIPDMWPGLVLGNNRQMIS